MKSTTNAFSSGISTDLHPLTIPNTYMDDALNATILTFNGNEQILQNDMGNTLIKDSVTGNIMALSDGFIPVGMKEYGGILYIASVNKDGVGELGTIPSPLISYTYNLTEAKNFDEVLADITGDSAGENGDATSDLRSRLNPNYFKVFDQVLHGGDQFMILLDLSSSIASTKREDVYVVENQQHSTEILNYKIVEQNKEVSGGTLPNTKKFQGWYKIKLYSILSSGRIVDITSLMTSNRHYYIESAAEEQLSDYWYIDTTQLGSNKIDLDRSQIGGCFTTYPNIPSGKLAIKIEAATIKNLRLIENSDYRCELPSIYGQSYVINNDSFIQYYVGIPGFKYEATGAINIDTLKVQCWAGGLPVDIYQYYPSTKLLVVNPTITVDANKYITPTNNTSVYPGGQTKFPYSYSIEEEKRLRSDEGCAFDIITEFNDDEYTHTISYSKDTKTPVNYNYLKSRNFSSDEHDSLVFVAIENYAVTLEFAVTPYMLGLDGTEIQIQDPLVFTYNPAVGKPLSSDLSNVVEVQYYDVDRTDPLYLEVRDAMPIIGNDIVKYNPTAKVYDVINRRSDSSKKFKSEDFLVYLYPIWSVVLNNNLLTKDDSALYISVEEEFGSNDNNSTLVTSEAQECVIPINKENKTYSDIKTICKDLQDLFKTFENDFGFTAEELENLGQLKTNLKLIQVSEGTHLNVDIYESGYKYSNALLDNTICDSFCQTGNDACLALTTSYSMDLRAKLFGPSKYSVPANIIKGKYNHPFHKRHKGNNSKKGTSFPYFMGKMLRYSPAAAVSFKPTTDSRDNISINGLTKRFEFLPINYNKPLSYLYGHKPYVTIYNKSDVGTKVCRIYNHNSNTSESEIPTTKLQVRVSDTDGIVNKVCDRIISKNLNSTVIDFNSGTYLDTPGKSQLYTVDLERPELWASVVYDTTLRTTAQKAGNLSINDTLSSSLSGIVMNSQLFADVSQLKFDNQSDYKIVTEIDIVDANGRNDTKGILTENNVSTVAQISIDIDNKLHDLEYYFSGNTPKELGYNSTYYKTKDLHKVQTSGSFNNVATGYYSFYESGIKAYIFHANINDGKNINMQYRLVIKNSTGDIVGYTDFDKTTNSAIIVTNSPDNDTYSITLQSKRRGSSTGSVEIPYIKNFGLYEIIIPENTEASTVNIVELKNLIDQIDWTNKTFSTVDGIKYVVMPTCFCLNELAECYDTTYNFQHLPDEAYLVVKGLYVLNTNDMKTSKPDDNYSGKVDSAVDYYTGKLIRISVYDE